MSTKSKHENAGKPWTEEDIMLVASYVPTWNNAVYLSNLIGRTPHAIQYMWCKLYMKAKDIKIKIGKNDDQWSKILKVRRSIKLWM